MVQLTGNLFHSGYTGRSEIDEFDCAVLVDQNISGLQILMEHLHAMQGPQSIDNLFGQHPGLVQIRRTMILNPLLQAAPLDVFGNIVEKVAIARLQNIQNMRVANPASDPLLMQKSFQIRRIIAVID